VAFLFGYADNPAKLLSLQHKMYMDGFVDKMQVPLKIVQPLGKRRYRSIESGICFLPHTLLHTCSSIWFPTVRKYGMTKEILMSIVNEENNG
jgi:long-subunit acyl-CoA synthetase (AMP-forming)